MYSLSNSQWLGGLQFKKKTLPKAKEIIRAPQSNIEPKNGSKVAQPSLCPKIKENNQDYSRFLGVFSSIFSWSSYLGITAELMNRYPEREKLLSSISTSLLSYSKSQKVNLHVLGNFTSIIFETARNYWTPPPPKKITFSWL